MNEELRMHAENIALFIRSDANQDQTERVYEWLKKYPKALEEIRSMPAKSKQDKAMLIMGAVITGRGFNEYCEIIKIKHDVIPVSEPDIDKFIQVQSQSQLTEDEKKYHHEICQRHKLDPFQWMALGMYIALTKYKAKK